MLSSCNLSKSTSKKPFFKIKLSPTSISDIFPVPDKFPKRTLVPFTDCIFEYVILFSEISGFVAVPVKSPDNMIVPKESVVDCISFGLTFNCSFTTPKDLCNEIGVGDNVLSKLPNIVCLGKGASLYEVID
ncbi:399R [Invertebrate iridescent virus Kaz2018]|uniref:399R n=1 Tax=Invertebrate iridescent virus 6 TaxID=176652 RepID=Q91FC6_IIV6|nr:399R [Invertebrate iridescent virus 6]AAK82259.1 399R [Invertebrate iridescent virus 6]QMS79534.1 hypothetical protein IIV6-T1_392 [Invertebrate iridescent virus 6]QNH08809.1 399R [Invertebrate iridescent virus Kaz2018]